MNRETIEHTGFLCRTLKLNDAMKIGNEIVVFAIPITHNKVKIYIKAPEELYIKPCNVIYRGRTYE